VLMVMGRRHSDFVDGQLPSPPYSLDIVEWLTQAVAAVTRVELV